MEFSAATFVKIEGTEVSISTSSIAETKIALKELKLKKKEYGLQKRALAGRQKEIRAGHTHEVRTRGSMLRGGGGFGKFVRFIQRASRDGKNSNLADALLPLEQEKQFCESIVHAIDSAILQLEMHLLKHSG